MKELSMFKNCGLTLEQAERIYGRYGIAFICEGDNNEYYFESEGQEWYVVICKRPNGLIRCL